MTAVQFNGGIVLGVKATTQFNGGIVVGVKQPLSSNFGVELQVQPDNLVAVTNASSVSNPTQATYIQNGVAVYSNPATLPPGDISKIKCYVSFSCSNIVTSQGGSLFSPVNMDIVTNWSVNITNEGGSWSVGSTSDYGTYGDPVKVFGLSGIIGKKGFQFSSNPTPATNSGILGLRNMNRELAFLVYGVPQYTANQVNQFIQAPNLQNTKTHADAARLIGSLCGANIHWGIRDFTSFNFQPQASMTGIQALSSLAAECGGVVRWNGDKDYLVTYPNKSTGIWQVPDCCLIVAMQRECNLDMNSGLYTPGTYMVPQLGTFNAGSASIYSTSDSSGSSSTTTLTNTSGNPLVAGNRATDPVETRHSSKTVMTSSSPPEYVDLPFDTQVIYIQNVVKTDFSGPYTTNDPNNWTVLQTGLNGAYTQWIENGGKVKPVLVLDPTMFPSSSNTDVTNGNWYLKIGVSRTPLASIATVTTTAENTIARNLLKYKWIPMCTGSVTCVFFGSIPMPGMTVIATLGGKTISGIIESVSFVNPGIITVNFVNWGELQYYTTLGNYSNPQLQGFPG